MNHNKFLAIISLIVACNMHVTFCPDNRILNAAYLAQQQFIQNQKKLFALTKEEARLIAENARLNTMWKTRKYSLGILCTGVVIGAVWNYYKRQQIIFLYNTILTPFENYLKKIEQLLEERDRILALKPQTNNPCFQKRIETHNTKVTKLTHKLETHDNNIRKLDSTLPTILSNYSAELSKTVIAATKQLYITL